MLSDTLSHQLLQPTRSMNLLSWLRQVRASVSSRVVHTHLCVDSLFQRIHNRASEDYAAISRGGSIFLL